MITEWKYYDAAGQKLQQYAAWSSGRLTALNRYTEANVRTLQAYISTTGNWVERHYSGLKQKGVRVWDSSGKYLGDQLQNFRNAASNLTPTTKDRWPF